ncbi:MAG TPA: hypothetical protein VIC25_04650 [Caulobacteraceae bacterium]
MGGGLAKSRSYRRAAVVTAVAGAAIWILTHQYIGTGGDGALYTLMALNRQSGGAFGADLFLRFGSQDAYSIFAPLYGVAIGGLGLFSANVALLMAAHLVWLAGAWLLCHRLVRGLAGHIAFLLVCALPLTYGGWSFLNAGETYLTSRPYAEGLVMVALAQLLARRWIVAAVAFGLAASFHPLMALAGLGAGFMTVAWKWPRLWLFAPLAAIGVAGLVLARVGPFAQALTIMDPNWLQAVRLRDPFVLMATWSPTDWTRLVCDLGPCLVAASLSQGLKRGMFAGVAMVAIAGHLSSLVAGDGLHDALIIQLQLGRCGWLPAVTQLPALVVIALRLRRASWGWLATALLAAPATLLTVGFEDFIWPAALFFTLAGVALAFGRGRLPTGSGARQRLWLIALAVLPAANLVFQTILMVRVWSFTHHLHLALAGEANFLPARLALLGGALALMVVARRRIATALAAAASALAAGLLVWNQATPWSRYVIAGATLPIAARIPPGAAVQWGIDAAPTWFLLRRPAFVTESQSAGLLFSRSTAQEWMRRRAEVGSLTPVDAWNPKRAEPRCARALAPLPAAAFAIACSRAPALYGVITPRPLEGSEAFVTAAPQETVCRRDNGEFGVVRTNRFYFRRCR